MKKTIKKFISILSIFLMTFSLTSCSQNIMEGEEITCHEIVTAYQKAGYEVEHVENNPIYDWKCYVKCTFPDTNDYIFFHYFETKEEAISYAKEREWNLVLYFVTLVMNDPTWLHTKVYNNIEIEYDEGYLYEPFESLLNS